MNYIKAIEKYLGRELKEDEVKIYSHVGKITIPVWNIPEKKKPTVKELEKIYNENELEILKEQKKDILRKKMRETVIQKMIDTDTDYITKKTEIENTGDTETLNNIEV